MMTEFVFEVRKTEPLIILWFGLSTGMDDEEDPTSPVDVMLDDKLRVSYYKAYLAAVHQAIQ